MIWNYLILIIQMMNCRLISLGFHEFLICFDRSNHLREWSNYCLKFHHLHSLLILRTVCLHIQFRFDHLILVYHPVNFQELVYQVRRKNEKEIFRSIPGYAQDSTYP